ncbi:hypothetical protein CPSG_01789 [Coccidioides posadasii str. Silveira]|uniref:Uncharacterized protein n=1 Tax=Coccidioides posadasii (strain RMSCC 757 / Silveira) TaxID=443226 RepID=E9CWF6_COCPS|nr:hypothetical protein CPSG_01789 [Coccidioides posadasii str. Silveira]
MHAGLVGYFQVFCALGLKNVDQTSRSDSFFPLLVVTHNNWDLEMLSYPNRWHTHWPSCGTGNQDGYR